MRPELYWITNAPIGRLAIAPRPRGGDWLIDELKSWKEAGVETVVSLLSDDETVELALHNESLHCNEIGLTFIEHPIADRGIPAAVDEFIELIDRLHKLLPEKGGIVIHCRMGIGRSSVVAACLLIRAGFSAQSAFKCISRARGMNVPDTMAQMLWVESISPRLRADSGPKS